MYYMWVVLSYHLCSMHVHCIYIAEYAAWAFRKMLSQGPVVVVSGGRVVARERVQALRQIAHGDGEDRVRRLCPGAVIRIRDGHVEQTAWEALIRAMHGITPFMEAVDPPFLYLGQAATSDVQAAAAAWGVQAGAGSGRAMARLAALRSAPGHVLTVPPEREQAFLDRFEVRRLLETGMPEDMVDQLELFGFHTLGALRRLTLRQVMAQFGADGERIHAMIHPEDDGRIPVHVPAPSVRVEHAWPDAVPAAERVLRPVLEELVARAVAGLEGRRCQCLGIELDVAGMREPATARRLLQAPQHAPGALLRLLWTMVEALVTRDMEVLGMTVGLESLRMPAVHQEDLFDARPAVMGAVRTIHRRYPGAVQRAALRPHAVFDEDRVHLHAVDVNRKP